jgi:lipopolysaccharide/colanic/teichoic acid biosynthesis glycosyltransferase
MPVATVTVLISIIRRRPAREGTLRQTIDSFVCALALLLLSPLLALIAIAVIVDSGMPVFFSHTRVGRDARTFQLVKFRTMRSGKSGPSITVGGDSRVTRVGKILRKFKLDELPQLWNVVRAEMSLVGPRPEVPEFVDINNPVWRSVLKVRPGITDPASIAYRNEEEVLAKSSDPIRFYKETVLPAKLALNLAYIQQRSAWRDMQVIFQTARCAVFPNHQLYPNGNQA